MSEKSENFRAGKDTFILRCEFYTQVKLLAREQRGDLLTALFAYARDEELPPLDGITSMCFEFIRASVDAYSDRYRAKCQKNRENGRRGGRPSKGDDQSIDDFVETTDCERVVLKPTKSKKTERFYSKANESDQRCEKPSGSERFAENTIGSKKNERAENNRDSDSDSDSECDIDIHTHTVKDKKEGGLGETNDDDVACNLLSWIATNVPTVAAMPEPLTKQNILWMLRKYRVEDIRRLILDMHNKRAYENMNAYTTFGNFARRDAQLNDRKLVDQPASSVRRYNYSEYLAMIDRQNGGKYRATDFICIRDDGKPYWILSNQLCKS